MSGRGRLVEMRLEEAVVFENPDYDSAIIGYDANSERVVYDPFMGSGTTALATLDIGGGRTYIGSEISEKYCKMAEDRIKIQTAQLTLF